MALYSINCESYLMQFIYCALEQYSQNYLNYFFCQSRRTAFFKPEVRLQLSIYSALKSSMYKHFSSIVFLNQKSREKSHLNLFDYLQDCGFFNEIQSFLYFYISLAQPGASEVLQPLEICVETCHFNFDRVYPGMISGGFGHSSHAIDLCNGAMTFRSTNLV